MRLIKKSAELLWFLGITFVAFGVAVCSKADLGVSMIAAPAFVISEFISSFASGLSVGVTEYIIQALILLILCIIIRKFNWRYLLAFAVAILYGYMLDLFLWLLADVNFKSVWLRFIMLIIGDIFTGFGVACFFRTYMPLQVYELFVSELSSHFKLNINKTKWCFDITLLVISVTLAFTLFSDIKTFALSKLLHTSFHSIGIGTLLTTLINSPLIRFMGTLVDKIFEPTPRFEGLKKLLKTD